MKTLRPLKGKKSKSSKAKKHRFGTADIEVHDWVNFKVIGYYDGYTNNFEWFDTLSEFMDYVFDHCYEHEIPNIFAHFGGKFDFNFILEEACFNEKYTVDGIIPRGSGLLSFDVIQREPTYWTPKGEPFKIVFRDSSALLPFALRSITKAFKVPMQKGDVDFAFLGDAWANENYVHKLLANPNTYDVFYGKRKIRKWNESYDLKKVSYNNKIENVTYPQIYQKHDILKYLNGDCVSLWQALETFYDWPLVRDSGSCFTTASQAVKIWRTFLPREVYSIPDYVDTFVRAGYFGGRTEIFKPYFDHSYNDKTNKYKFGKTALKNLKAQKGLTMNYIDVNSLYPTVMKDEVYPIRFQGWAPKGFYDPNSLAFWEVDVTVPEMFCPPLGTKHVFEDGTEKFIFPIGKFKGIWCTQELEYAKTLGVTVDKVYRGAVFDSGGYIFSDFITELYDVRLKAKSENDDTSNMLAKLFMNSCYGRLGLNIERTNLMIDSGESYVCPDTGRRLMPHSEIRRGEDTIRFVEKPVVLEDSFTNVAISAYVTAYSRILMHKEIYMVAGEEHLYYTDTDSAFTTKDLSFFKIGDQLGELKLEYTCNSACFLLPKTYINDGCVGEDFEKKLTMKGFDKKKIKNFTMEDFTLALKGDLKNLKVYQAPKFATLKTALNKGRFVAMAYDPIAQKSYDIEDLKKSEMRLKRSLNPNEINALIVRIRSLKKKIEADAYGKSYRSIKSKYDKRVIIEEGFNTKPIKL